MTSGRTSGRSGPLETASHDIIKGSTGYKERGAFHDGCTKLLQLLFAFLTGCATVGSSTSPDEPGQSSDFIQEESKLRYQHRKENLDRSEGCRSTHFTSGSVRLLSFAYATHHNPISSVQDNLSIEFHLPEDHCPYLEVIELPPQRCQYRMDNVVSPKGWQSGQWNEIQWPVSQVFTKIKYLNINKDIGLRVRLLRSRHANSAKQGREGGPCNGMDKPREQADAYTPVLLGGRERLNAPAAYVFLIVTDSSVNALEWRVDNMHDRQLAEGTLPSFQKGVVQPIEPDLSRASSGLYKLRVWGKWGSGADLRTVFPFYHHRISRVVR